MSPFYALALSSILNTELSTCDERWRVSRRSPINTTHILFMLALGVSGDRLLLVQWSVQVLQLEECANEAEDAAAPFIAR